MQRVAVYLHEAGSTTKVVQSILEMLRGGIRDLPVELGIFHDGPAPLEQSFVLARLPVMRLEGAWRSRTGNSARRSEQGRFDYVVLFESSGMYNGEDIANLASHLRLGRLDAVWGSRRLSVNDIHESYRLKYRHRSMLGAISYVGSHALSLLYLLCTAATSRTRCRRRGSFVPRTCCACRLPERQTGQPAAAVGAVATKSGDVRGAGAVLLDLAGAVKRTSPLDGLRAAGTVLKARVP